MKRRCDERIPIKKGEKIVRLYNIVWQIEDGAAGAEREK